MKFNKILMGAILATSLIPMVGQAQPSKFSKCAENIKVKVPEGSSGHYFSEDCSQLYVLPPRVGTMRIAVTRKNAGLDNSCRELQDIDYNLAEDIEIINKDQEWKRKRVAKLQDYLEDGYVPLGKTVEEVRQEISELRKSLREDRKERDQVRKTALTDKSTYAMYEGATGKFVIENPYIELVQEYQRKNPRLTVYKMPIDQSYVATVGRSFDGAKGAPELPAVLDLSIPGISQLPALNSAGSLLVEKDLVPFKYNDNVNLMGESLSGILRLSSYGACKVTDFVNSKEWAPMSSLKAHIAANLTYQYQLQVKKNHYIRINMKDLILKIHKQTKKGGLFNRKTVNSFINTNKHESWITFESKYEDLRFKYSDEYIKEIKKQFLDYAIARIIEVKTGVPVAQLALLDPSGKNGADVIGDELKKCPNIYCQIGAAGMKVLSSIFGSEQAVAEMSKSFEGDVWQKETHYGTVPAVGTMPFE